jgi:uncharacterized cofD-like protein
MYLSKNSTIAVFDSGIGGISILKQLIQKFGCGNYIYYADNLYMPYGSKSKNFIKHRVDTIIDKLNNEYNADLIIMGPGSLYTSVISNFLVKDITRAIWQAKAKKIYVCNAMTQVGETDNYSVSDHVKTIFDHVRLADIDDSKKNFFDAVLVNNSMPANLAEKYEQAGSLPVDIDITELRKLGLEVIEHSLLEDNKQGFVRHNCDKVAKAIYYWYKRVSKAK